MSDTKEKTISEQLEELKIELMRKDQQIKCLNDVMLGVLEEQKVMQTSIRMLHDSTIRMNEDRVKAIERALDLKPGDPYMETSDKEGIVFIGHNGRVCRPCDLSHPDRV